jgi:hypothetical protein
MALHLCKRYTLALNLPNLLLRLNSSKPETVCHKKNQEKVKEYLRSILDEDLAKGSLHEKLPSSGPVEWTEGGLSEKKRIGKGLGWRRIE